MKTYLQRNDDRLIWEEADEFIAQNIGKVLMANGLPRYNGNYIFEDEGTFSIKASDLSQVDIAVIARFLGAREGIAPVSKPGGFVQEQPEYLKVLIGKRTILHERNGTNFKVAS